MLTGWRGARVQLFRLTEQPLDSSFATLFQRNLYTLAIGLAHSRGLGADQIAESYRRCAPFPLL